MTYLIPNGLKIYLLFYSLSFLLSLYVMLKNRKDYEFFGKRYWHFLFEPWKLVTFIAGTLVITLAAPYSSDPTWDYPDSILISILTFVISPWSVAVLYRGLKRKTMDSKWFVALFSFFIPCWVYDLYILFRDKIYPPTWAPNLFLSGFIVLLAGLFWNIGWSEERGTFFSFSMDEWPVRCATPLRRILWMLIILSLPVIVMVAWFVLTT